jgi:hypothetical protein
VLEVGDGTNGDLSDLRLKLSLELLPHRLGNVETGEGRALLSLVLKGTTDGTDDGSADVGGRVDELEVLATSLTDDTGVGEVLVDVVADLLPEVLEDVGRTGEVETSEHAVGEDLVDEGDGGVAVGAGEELDDVLGETSLVEDLENEPRGVGSSGRGLPDEDVSDESGGADEVTGDGGEAAGRGESV